MKKRYIALFALVISSIGLFIQSCASFGRRNSGVPQNSLLTSDTGSSEDSIAYLGNNSFVLYKNGFATDTVHFEKGQTYLTKEGLSRVKGKVYLNGKDIKADDQTLTWKEWRMQHNSHRSHASHYSSLPSHSNNK